MPNQNLAIKKELSESGIQIDQAEDSNQIKIKEFNKKINHNSSHLDGSSGVDSGPSSDEHSPKQTLIKSTNLIKSINKDRPLLRYVDEKRQELIEAIKEFNQTNSEETNDQVFLQNSLHTQQQQLSKSKSLLNVDDQQYKKNDFLKPDHRLSNEEFKRRRRSYEVNLDCLEQQDNLAATTKKDLRRKSTNYLLNQSFNQLSNEDITKIKRELIRRSEERLARFESSISSRSNSVINSVNNSLIESISTATQNSKLDQLQNSNSINENLDDDYRDERIVSRKDINNKWREVLKRSDSLDSLNSIKSINSLINEEELSNMKVISRRMIKSQTNLIQDENLIDDETNEIEKISEDEYDYLTNNDHYVYKNRITGEYLTENNLIHCRSIMQKEVGGLNVNNENEMPYYSKRYGEELNDYDELIENSYVEVSEDNCRSANEHTYKMISENAYDSLNEENPYISIRDDFASIKERDYENINQLREEYLLRNQFEEEEDYYQNIQSIRSSNKEQHKPSAIQRGESFNHSNTYQLSSVKLPLKRSKSVPSSNTLNSKYLNGNNKLIVNGKLSLSKTSIGKVKEDFCQLNDQLEFQKKHLRQLHKQHWKYRLKNAETNDEINEYTSLFNLNQENFNSPGELLISINYNEQAKQIQLLIKECRNFGNNLNNKYLKIYLLPDKASKQRSSLQSKTIGHINNLIEKKSFEICSPLINKKFVFQCDQMDELTSSRTIFISVCKIKRSLLEKNQCLGELFLKVKDSLEDNLKEKGDDQYKQQSIESANNLNIKLNLEQTDSKLSFKWYSLDSNLNYFGELAFSIFYDTDKNQLKIELLGCVNLLTSKRDVRALNTFCKVELKRASIERSSEANDETKDINDDDLQDELKESRKVRFSEEIEEKQSIKLASSLIDTQKTVIIKNSINPKYNKLFIFNDIHAEQLDFTSLDITIWNCSSALSSPYRLAGIQLGKSNLVMHSVRKLNSNEMITSLERCIQDELNVWQEITDRTKFNNWINACLQLRPID